MSDSSPNYYAIIPANVRYCKDLEPSAKLLYGEITALSNKEGYCWATNAHFAELYEVDTRTIQRWLESLKNKEFIEIEIEKNNFKTTRKIFLSKEIKKIVTTRQKCRTETTKMSYRDDKNVVQNSTSNNTSNNPPLSSPPKIAKRSEEKSLRSEEEDFFIDNLLEETDLNESDCARLKVKYSNNEIVAALRKSKGQPIKKSLMSLLINILENPDRWTETVEIAPLTINQQIALKFNEELRKVYPNLAKRNEENILKLFIELPDYILNRTTTASLNFHDFQKEIKQASIDLQTKSKLGL